MSEPTDKDLPLWSDDMDEHAIMLCAKGLAVHNLLEDIKCLKEDIDGLKHNAAQLQAEVHRLT